MDKEFPKGYSYNPDTDGTVYGTKPQDYNPEYGHLGKTMAEALRSISTAVEYLPDGTLVPLHSKQSTDLNSENSTSTRDEKAVVYCGDCGNPLPCPHSNGSKTIGH